MHSIGQFRLSRQVSVQSRGRWKAARVPGATLVRFTRGSFGTVGRPFLQSPPHWASFLSFPMGSADRHQRFNNSSAPRTVAWLGLCFVPSTVVETGVAQRGEILVESIALVRVETLKFAASQSHHPKTYKKFVVSKSHHPNTYFSILVRWTHAGLKLLPPFHPATPRKISTPCFGFCRCSKRHWH